MAGKANPHADYIELLARKEQLQRDLNLLEDQIFNYETTYLKESPFGNVVRGWAAYKDPSIQASYEMTVDDRLFSLSSVTSQVQPEAKK